MKKRRRFSDDLSCILPSLHAYQLPPHKKSIKTNISTHKKRMNKKDR